MLKGNKGEWSELYVLLKLLYEQELYETNSELEILKNLCYPIIKIKRLEKRNCNSIKEREYICGARVRIVDGVTGNKILEVNLNEFKENAEKLKQGIINGRGRSFSIPVLNDFLKLIDCEKVRADSEDKRDITIVVHDIKTGREPSLGFSIKSKLGGAPTLINASKENTNFIYEITCNNLTDEKINIINDINTGAKIINRMKALQDLGATITYRKMERDIFLSNLQVIDSALPEIVAQMLLSNYLGISSKLKDLVEEVARINPCNFSNKYSHPFYEYKVKNLLVDAALGMKPAKPWYGFYDATGGYIEVNKEGDILCFFMYNRNDLQEYLFNNTKLETPGSDKHKFGSIYKENDKYFIKLNLQIRFI